MNTDGSNPYFRVVDDNGRPGAVWVFGQLVEIMMADNGGRYVVTPEDHEAAILPIEALLDAGYFRDDPENMDESYWQAAAGEYNEAREFFAPAIEDYLALDLALNEIFERPAP